MDQNILAILGIAILILLVVILFIIIKNRTNSTQSDLLKLLETMTKNTDQIVEASKNLHERMIRVETTVDKITKGVDDGFRDNRKEIATNLQTIQKTPDVYSPLVVLWRPHEDFSARWSSRNRLTM